MNQVESETSNTKRSVSDMISDMKKYCLLYTILVFQCYMLVQQHNQFVDARSKENDHVESLERTFRFFSGIRKLLSAFTSRTLLASNPSNPQNEGDNLDHFECDNLYMHSGVVVRNEGIQGRKQLATKTG